jgi:hypothetical protein
MRLHKDVEGHLHVMLGGGFGNQLFQYFAARRIANLHGSKLYVNTSRLANFHAEGTPLDRSFKLNSLPFIPQMNISNETSTEFKCRLNNIWPNIAQNLGVINDENYFNVIKRKNLVLDGFFQFASIITEERKKIIGEIQLNDFSIKASGLLKSVESFKDAICIHLRLGDYLELKDFEILSDEYLQRCLEDIKKHCGTVQIYVMTDSEELVNRIYPWLFKKYKINVLKSSCLEPAELIHIMKNFKFLVLAKSSLSWWAGFLASDLGHTVYAPHFKEQAKVGNFRPDQILIDWRVFPNEIKSMY